MAIAILIPAFNEEKTISGVIKALPRKINSQKIVVLVVDDGSTDQTSVIARRMGAVVINHEVNYGVGKAFQTGVEKALEMGMDILVTIDADGQFEPKEIGMLIQPILDDRADFVSGNRFGQLNKPYHQPMEMPKAKLWGNIFMAKLISFLTRQKYKDVACGFRAYSRKALLWLNLSGRFTYTQETFIDMVFKGMRIETVLVSVIYYPNRKSKIANNLLKYAYQTLKIVIRTFRDYKPLLFFIYLSILPLAISVFMGGFLTLYFLKTGSFTPYKSIGIAFIYFSTMAFLLWVVGFLADMFVRLRLSQEKILYLEKIQYYRSITL